MTDLFVWRPYVLFNVIFNIVKSCKNKIRKQFEKYGTILLRRSFGRFSFFRSFWTIAEGQPDVRSFQKENIIQEILLEWPGCSKHAWRIWSALICENLKSHVEILGAKSFKKFHLKEFARKKIPTAKNSRKNYFKKMFYLKKKLKVNIFDIK